MLHPITKTIGDTKNFNAKDYITDAYALDFNSIYYNCHPDDMLNTFNTLLKSVIDKHAPLKTIKVTR